jgi:hypothetical protein
MTWLGGGEAERDSGPDRTWLLESELAPGRPFKSKQGFRKHRGRFPSTRIELRYLLAVIALAGLFFAVVRSWLVLDVIGLLIWPVLLGFGIDRLCAGEGVCGGTGAGALGFVGMALAVPGGLLVLSSGALNPIGFLSTLVVGAIWGFYLSIWIYMVVETIIYYCY